VQAGIEAAARDGRAPAALLQASASGVNGDTGDTVVRDGYDVDRSTDGCVKWPRAALSPRARGEAFRRETCLDMEALAATTPDLVAVAARRSTAGGAQPAAVAATRVVALRIGMVLALEGALLQYLRVAALCRVSRIGSGRQWVPWIHLDDAGGAIASMAVKALGGARGGGVSAVNVASPNPARLCDLLAAIRAATASSWLSWGVVPVPQYAFELAVGEASSVVLDSCRAAPDRVVASGYVFRHPTLATALVSWACQDRQY
jgi:NAD dependent epimerase/dehydratase family enzyme